MKIEQLKNKIHHADCMDIMKDIQDKYIDLAIVDPPYGILSQNDKRQLSRYGQNNFIEKPDQKYFNELFRISQNQIIWGANNFQLSETEYFIIWDKQQTVDNFASAEYAWTNIKQPARVFRYSIHKEMSERKKNGGKIHPTQKPVKLYRWLLQKYANQGDLILDTHSGSASCAVACMLEGFDFIAIEKDYDYWKSSIERFEIEKEQLKLF